MTEFKQSAILSHMIYLKSLSKIVFFIVLVALSNSFIIHPATELQKKHVVHHTQEDSGDESQCCFLCHTTHHQGIVSSGLGNESHVLSVSTYHAPLAVNFDPSPLLNSVFRPPLAF